MKPAIKNKLAVFAPHGFLDGGNARSVIDNQDIEFLKTTKCEVVLVSLKKVIFFNKRGLSNVLENLQIIGNYLGAMIGFCDYEERKYDMIMDIFNNNVPFSLFDTEQIGGLFAGNLSKNAKEQKVLLYSSSNEQRNYLSIELFELGFEPCIAKSVAEFNDKKDNFTYLIRHSRLGVFDRSIRINIKDNVIIYTLKEFLDSSLAEEFDMLHHSNALKIGFSYFLFDCEKVSSTNIHAINFLAKLSTAGAEYGATIAVSGLSNNNITQTLKNDLEDAGILVYDDINAFFTDTQLQSDGGALSNKKPRNITKKLVEILSLVIQTTTKTIESMTHQNLERKSIKIQDLSISKNEKLAVAIAFYGKIEGIMVLVFDEKVAKRSCAVLLDENYSKEQLCEALGELVNIIGGKLIQQMKKKDYKVNITMPRTYKDIDELLAHKKGTKGAQVDFDINGDEVVLFLTR